MSNAEEFGDWLVTVRGDTEVIVDEHRPVPLWQHVLVGNRLLRPVRRGDAGGRRRSTPSWCGSPASRTASPPRPSGPRAPHPAAARPRRTRAARRPAAAAVDVIERLDRDGLLPAITFIFSRAGCDAAVQQCLRAGLRLTTDDERDEIRAIVERAHAPTCPTRTSACSATGSGCEALERGIAAHHAGLLPAFKEVVEELFVRGLVKAVFATETLALGINMPARSVVLEKLVKWNGETHADITPGEYTQLTGRAGRRGIDVEGHAVVLWQPGVDPRRSPAWPRPAPTRCAQSSGPSTTWPSTWSARSAATAPASCWRRRSRSSRPTGRWSGWPGRCARNEEALAGYARR